MLWSTGLLQHQQVESINDRGRLYLALRCGFERRLPAPKLVVRESSINVVSARSRVRAANSLRLEHVC